MHSYDAGATTDVYELGAKADIGAWYAWLCICSMLPFAISSTQACSAELYSNMRKSWGSTLDLEVHVHSSRSQVLRVTTLS